MSGGRHYSSIDDFLESIFFREFRLVATQRRKIVALIKGAQPAASNRRIARAVGVDEITVRRDAANVAASSKAANEINGAISAAATNVAPHRLWRW